MGTFPQVFRHAKEVPILQLHETIRLPHIDASPIDFLLFYQQSCQGGVFKIMKNDHFLVFLVVLAVSPSLYAGKEWPVLELHEAISVPHIVSCLIVFLLFCE